MGEGKIMTTDTRSDTAVTTETSCSASFCIYNLFLKNRFFPDLLKDVVSVLA